ncbi:LicD family protein [Nitrosomonas ureae]|uniref:Methyltransferase domain-containing protein n=1 Tax=Nitrosomonas ureae TaxID=44577 RepID=A0A1H5UHZ4_9PROT|nr:LicD family protein [Nitrosomonas ureae]SEF74629.1 Methyltransferase domain-containing protein [Nitrosomonas ureae]
MSIEKTPLSCGIDRLDMSLISGWARYLDNNEPMEIELVMNDVRIGTFRADLYRADLAVMRQDGKFAFRIEPGLNTDLMRQCVPAGAIVYLRDAKTKSILHNSTRTWDGLAPKDQQGIRNASGQQFQLGKGRFVVPLKERSAEWRIGILSITKELARDATAAGFILSAAYGTLLGAVREKAMIPHDDDVDMMLLATSSSMLGAVHELKAFEDYLSSKGYKVEELSNGQIHVTVGNQSIDIFLGWFENARLSLTFTVKQGPEQIDILPLGTVFIEGVELPAPNTPEPLLAAIYGPDWKTPDPLFQWKCPAEVVNYFSPIHNYNRSANIDYWRNYYTTRSNLSPPDYPSQFALFMMGLQRNPKLIVDLGCGSGRDSLFFATQGLRVIGLDYADSAITKNSVRALAKGLCNVASFIRCDVSDLSDVEKNLTHIALNKGDGSICVYSRFFFHAIDENTEGAALLLVSQLLSKTDDFAVFEFRTEHDREREKVTPAHFRRYINVDKFVERAQQFYSLNCIYRAEGLGYAIFGVDDAHVARLIFARRT